MKEYKALNKQIFTSGDYSLVPIRFEDRYDIMKWRNEQIYHLRQAEPLTTEKQDQYFNTAINALFEQEKPSQILFSYLYKGQCIGYGGLVHINWVNKNAEISFIMKTALEAECFVFHWQVYLNLLEKFAFADLGLHKIFTYAFDIRPKLYEALILSGFKKEATLSEHCLFQGKYIDVVIHKKLNRVVELIPATLEDVDVTFEWASTKAVRRYSLTQCDIVYEAHSKWFNSKLEDENCIYTLAVNPTTGNVLGSFRLDLSETVGLISYLLAEEFHGKGWGAELLKAGIELAKKNERVAVLNGQVLKENIPSIKLFEKLGFEPIHQEENLVTYSMKLR
jgi:RimJ/RimL family protein N-acetyltransferase